LSPQRPLSSLGRGVSMVSSLFLRLFSASHSPSRGESMPFCLLRSLSISSWASPCLIHARRSYQVYDRNCCSAPAKVEENGVRRKWCQTPSEENGVSLGSRS